MDDSFACPHCGKQFTPQTFPFKYQYHSGGGGLGSEWTEVLDSQCPECKRNIPKSFFTVCNACKKGAVKTSCAYQEVGTSIELYHFSCLHKLIPPIAKGNARRYGEPAQQKPAAISLADIPIWMWIVGVVVLLLLLKSA
jgi:hypothetical protein